jgi:hypothetical protein
VGNVGAIAPTIQLRDAFGNPVPGHSVQFVIGSGGGSAVGSSVKSDENGMAVGRWTLGTSVGTNTLKAAVAGLAPITFSATGKADTPALYRFVDGRGQIEVVSTSLPVVPRVRVLDRFGNRIAGVAVSFSVAAGAVRSTCPPGRRTPKARSHRARGALDQRRASMSCERIHRGSSKSDSWRVPCRHRRFPLRCASCQGRSHQQRYGSWCSRLLRDCRKCSCTHRDLCKWSSRPMHALLASLQ